MFDIVKRAATCGALVMAVGVGVSSRAEAAPCRDLPNPIFGRGGSAQKGMFARVGTKLAGTITLVHQAPGACVGYNDLVAGTRMTGTASYWDSTGRELQCDLPLTGQAIDFANMGNAATSCPGVTAIPGDIGDYEGPVTTWNLFVPTLSSQQSISAEAVFIVFGFGSQSQVTPWNDETQLVRRDANSAATLALSLATSLPPDRFRGVDAMTNPRSIALVANATNAEAALGYASGEFADANRATVRTLAYQHTGQRCGYWPDSTPTEFDKRSVRNGLYWLWSLTHFFARKDATGQIANPTLRTFIGFFTGAVAPPSNFNIVEEEIRSGNIPRCAMNVTRAGDFTPLQPYTPAAPCGCYFESIANGRVPTSCTACTGDGAGQCGGSNPVCRFGFCEAR